MKKTLLILFLALVFGAFTGNAQEYWLNDDFSSSQWVTDIQNWLEANGYSLPGSDSATESTAGFPEINGYLIDGAVYTTKDDIVESTNCAENSSVKHQYSFRLRNNKGGYIRLPKVANAGILKIHVRNGNGGNDVTFKLQRKVGTSSWVDLASATGIGFNSYPSGEIDEIHTFLINSKDSIELQLTGSDRFLNVFKITLEKYDTGAYQLHDDFSSLLWINAVEAVAGSLPAAGGNVELVNGDGSKDVSINDYQINGFYQRSSSTEVALGCSENSDGKHEYGFRIRNGASAVSYLQFPKVENAGTLYLHIRNSNGSTTTSLYLQKYDEILKEWETVETMSVIGNTSHSNSTDLLYTCEINSPDSIQLRLYRGGTTFINIFEVALTKCQFVPIAGNLIADPTINNIAKFDTETTGSIITISEDPSLHIPSDASCGKIAEGDGIVNARLIQALESNTTYIMEAKIKGNGRLGVNPETLGTTGVSQDFVDTGNWEDVSWEFTTGAEAMTEQKVYFSQGNNQSGDSYIDNWVVYRKSPAWSATAASTDWAVAANWVEGRTPLNTDDVVIRAHTGTNKYYPALTSPDVTVNTITFEPGAELGGQNYLTTTNGATVKYILSGDTRWHMLTAPVEGVTTTKDFSFRTTANPDNPYVWLLEFEPEGQNANWKFRNQGESLDIGEGFAVSIGSDVVNDEVIAWKADDDLVDYPASFSGNLWKDGTNTVFTVSELTFGADGGRDFALVGNPFMTSIDFRVLYNSVNSNIINNNYLVWTKEGTEEGFVGYAAIGSYGIEAIGTGTATNDEYIAPLQSFFVEKYNGGALTFDLSAVSATGQGSLRASESDDYGKLDILADNETVPVKTFITNKEDMESARKLKNGCGNIPDIYTLSSDNAFAYGAQVINTNTAVTIPLVIATEKEGKTTLTFSGMSSFADTNIQLIDGEEIINLTGDSYSYEFDYIPPTAKDEKGKDVAVANENRFYIAFSPSSITGNDNIDAENLSVYISNNAIHAVSTLSDLIRRITVYDVQGRILYTTDKLNTPVYTINTLENKTVYILKIITGKSVKTVKVINE